MKQSLLKSFTEESLKRFDDLFEGELWLGKPGCDEGKDTGDRMDLKQYLESELKAFAKKIQEEVEKLRVTEEIQEPKLKQFEKRGSAPFYCTLCGMGEFNISENKTEEGKYFCLCSYWSDPQEWENKFNETWWKLLGSGEEQSYLWLKDFISKTISKALIKERESIKKMVLNIENPYDSDDQYGSYLSWEEYAKEVLNKVLSFLTQE